MQTERDAILGAVARIARLSFPHDVSDEVYLRAAEKAVDEIAADPLLQVRIGVGLAETALAETDDERLLESLRPIGDEPWFRDLRQLLLPGVYGDPEVWRLIGFEGPSFDLGGYIDRGFNDLDWLPDPRVEECDEPLPEIVLNESEAER